jgi:RNA polymerase sigma-70 factor (ECF subfamily)
VSDVDVRKIALVSPLAPRAATSAVAIREIDVAAAFRHHYDFVFRVLLCTGVPRPACDDAIQDVFVTVHRRRRDYDGRAPLRHWIYGIAKGVGRNYGRKARRRASRVVELPALGDGLAAGPQADCEYLVERGRQLSVVAAMLEALGDEQREVFVLIHVEGMTAPEVARMVDVSVNTVYSRLRLARSKFEKLAAERAEDIGRDRDEPCEVGGNAS